jgi:nucleoside-diphosphate-sugar epimerase
MALTAFITGATGFVGMNLARELAGNGWDVTALVRKDSPLEDLAGLELDLRQGDITDAESVKTAMPSGVDCVFHVAASTNVWSRKDAEQTRINVEGTRNVVSAALHHGAGRMIHTSSFVVWGFQPGLLTEKTERLDNADWINYVRTKASAEVLVREAMDAHGLDAVILNPAHILGPGDRRNWSRMIRLVDSRSLPGIPPGGGAFSDVREIARAHREAYHRGRSGHNYLLGGEDRQFIDVVKLTGELLGRKVPRRASPAWLLHGAAKLYVLRAAIDGREPDVTPEAAAMITRHIRCDSGKAQRELGYRFTPIRSLLEDTIAWMREKNMLRKEHAR